MNAKQKKIAIFHQEFYFSGGAERLIFEEIEALEKKGFYVEAWAPLVDYNKCFPEQIKNFKVKGFLPFFSFIPRELLILIASVMAPLLVLKFRDFDLFYGTNQAGPWFAFVAAKILRKPYILFMPYPVGLLYPRKIDQDAGLLEEVPLFIRMAMFFFKPSIKYLDRQIISQADAVITGGSYAKGIFKKIYRREVLDAPSGADTKGWSEINYSTRWKGSVKLGKKTVSKPYILITNRSMPKKKFEYAIEALASLTGRYPKATLAVAGGENKYTEKLKELAKKLGVEDRVIFLGFIDGRNLEKAYFNACIYTYTAPEEDFGKGMVEAMAAGVPVVAWNNAGPTGIVVDGKTGYLAKPFSSKDFSGKILRLLTNKDLNQKMAMESIKLVKKKFTKRVHQRILEKEIKKALKNGKK